LSDKGSGRLSSEAVLPTPVAGSVSLKEQEAALALVQTSAAKSASFVDFE
jgi:hypothetical protein